MGRSQWEARDGTWVLRTKLALGEKSEPAALVAAGASSGIRFLAWDGHGPREWRGSRGGIIDICVAGAVEPLEIDPEMGPRICAADGTASWLHSIENGKRWPERDSADQKVLAYKVARMNMEARRLQPELARQAAGRAKALEAAAGERRLEGLRRALAEKLRQGSRREIIEARCQVELARPPVPWTFISIEIVGNNHSRRAPGMLYGLEFPWNEELLTEFGPAWLTKAFRAAGTMDLGNRVTSVTVDKNIKIDAGNNAGKFLFEVTYERQTSDLDTLLFAKVPFAMTAQTKSDRFSSSVYKQPMDLHEINTYRLIEAAFPMQTPKFYYGDISNETSNFILITARIPYSEIGREKVGEGQLKPFEIEGPYDKCKDSIQLLRGPAEDYYSLLMTVSAKIAALDKAGKMCSREVLVASLRPPPADPTQPAAWGMRPSAASGEAPASIKKKLEVALKFVTETASALFPEYVTSKAFQDKFLDTMMTWSAYANEIQYWLHNNADYVALGHNNLNADNAYFWRDENGKLDCGVIDWGGFGAGPLGHKMWWSLNCADFDQIQRTLPRYIENFIATYQKHGGPALDPKVFESQVLITSLGNMMFMVAAVPNCFKMCAAKEWATIKDRHDPRVAGNIDGKSTLRTTLHVLNNGIRVLEELGSDRALRAWIQEVYVSKWGQTAKTDKIIHGT